MKMQGNINTSIVTIRKKELAKPTAPLRLEPGSVHRVEAPQSLEGLICSKWRPGHLDVTCRGCD